MFDLSLLLMFVCVMFSCCWLSFFYSFPCVASTFVLSDIADASGLIFCVSVFALYPCCFPGFLFLFTNITIFALEIYRLF